MHRIFIKDISNFSIPLTGLLVKDILFYFDEAYVDTISILEHALTKPPILKSPNWSIPFEIICDETNHVIGVVLGQKINTKKLSFTMLMELFLI